MCNCYIQYFAQIKSLYKYLFYKKKFWQVIVLVDDNITLWQCINISYQGIQGFTGNKQPFIPVVNSITISIPNHKDLQTIRNVVI